MNMILFIHVQVGLNHPEFIFNTNTDGWIFDSCGP